MATSNDHTQINIITEVEDVMKNLMELTDGLLEDNIDLNDIYHILEGMAKNKLSTKDQRLLATVDIVKSKLSNIGNCDKKERFQNFAASKYHNAAEKKDEYDSEIHEELSEGSLEDVSETDDQTMNQKKNNEPGQLDLSFKKHLNSLIRLYPDVDRLTLKNKSKEFGCDWQGLESWLTSNIDLLPQRKQVLALSRLQLSDRTKMSDQVLSQCPDCESWKLVEKGDIGECDEVGCGIFYCLFCNKKDHRPFHCRKNDDSYRRRVDKDTNSLFKPLMELPTTQKDGLKRFFMFPKNDMDWTNPLDIIYMTAEATFLRMVDKSPLNNGHVTRRSIQSIEYIENQSNTTTFLTKQNNFLAKGINSKERLCFHGTPITNIESILRENFSNEKIKRCAYGRGHYFSEFPDVSAGYGPGLLLCRILTGTSWTDSSSSNIPESYNSKIVKPDEGGRGWAVVIPDSQQILPAFLIKLNK